MPSTDALVPVPAATPEPTPAERGEQTWAAIQAAHAEAAERARASAAAIEAASAATAETARASGAALEAANAEAARTGGRPPGATP